jgi:hypothetical protein
MTHEEFEYLCAHPEIFEMSFDEWLDTQPKEDWEDLIKEREYNCMPPLNAETWSKIKAKYIDPID